MTRRWIVPFTFLIVVAWGWFVSSFQDIPVVLKWAALFGMLILVALSWVRGVKDFLGHKTRVGIGSIVSGVGLLVWALLAAHISPRDCFISPVEWGMLVVGGIFIFAGAVLADKERYTGS